MALLMHRSQPSKSDARKHVTKKLLLERNRQILDWDIDRRPLRWGVWAQGFLHKVPSLGVVSGTLRPAPGCGLLSVEVWGPRFHVLLKSAGRPGSPVVYSVLEMVAPPWHRAHGRWRSCDHNGSCFLDKAPRAASGSWAGPEL